MKLVRMKWEGKEYTKAYLQPGGEKEKIEAGSTFECDEGVAEQLQRYDKKYVLLGEAKVEEKSPKKVKAKKPKKATS